MSSWISDFIIRSRWTGIIGLIHHYTLRLYDWLIVQIVVGRHRYVHIIYIERYTYKIFVRLI